VTVLEAKGIAVSFGGVKALQGVDLRVDAGEVVGIIGANGAGKTTLFDCLSGITDCEGTVLLDGAPTGTGCSSSRSQAASTGTPQRPKSTSPSSTTTTTRPIRSTAPSASS
jgi:branched-chain amino acid transport system ATP-binding protein